MRVTLATHGGLAAPINLGRPLRAVDTATLPPDQARHLRWLIGAAVPAEPAEAAAGSTARDAMSYTITVEEGDTTTVLKMSDTGASPAFADLLAWLEAHAR